jgi:hypothetical protein
MSGWIISDFQKTIADISATDTTFELNLLPLRGVQEKNVSIDTAWFESPVQTLHQTSVLLFRLHNYSTEDLDNIRVSIDLDGQERPEGTIDLRSSESIIDTARITVLTTGWHELAIRISDYPVTFDDAYFITFYVEENLKILSINQSDGNKEINAVFADPKYFILENSSASQLQYSRFQDYQLIILNELLQLPSGLISAMKRYVEEGGKALFIPAQDGPIEPYNALMHAMSADALTPWENRERQVGTINTDAFVFNDVFTRTRPNMRLPKVKGAFGISGAGRKGEPLLTYRDGGIFVNWYTPGAGAFCVISSSLDGSISDLTLQPEIFVPLIYKTAIYTSESTKVSYTIGVDDLIPMDRNQLRINENVVISGTSEFRPGLSPSGAKILLDVQGQVQRAGFYKVLQQDQLIASLGFNYDRRESDLAVVPVEDLPSNDKIKIWNQGDAADFTDLIQSTQQGKPLWKWCIILSLLFIAAEIALIRLWKN